MASDRTERLVTLPADHNEHGLSPQQRSFRDLRPFQAGTERQSERPTQGHRCTLISPTVADGSGSGCVSRPM
jgi:hypothetical protein